MTEYSQIIEDPLFVITGNYLRTLVRHDKDLRRALRALSFAVNSKIYRKDLFDPCRIQLSIIKDRVEQGRIQEASDAEMEAIENAWTNILVKRIVKAMK